MESRDEQFMVYLHLAVICSKANHGQMEALKYWLNDPQAPWRLVFLYSKSRRIQAGAEKTTTIQCHVLYNIDGVTQ